MDEMNMTSLEQQYSTVHTDRGWSPPDCQPQSTIAIIMPFRDRERHLRIFFNNIIPFLQRQNIAFQVFVIDQVLVASKYEQSLYNRENILHLETDIRRIERKAQMVFLIFFC